jgi:hypothetical protein
MDNFPSPSSPSSSFSSSTSLTNIDHNHHHHHKSTSTNIAYLSDCFIGPPQERKKGIVYSSKHLSVYSLVLYIRKTLLFRFIV